MLATLETTVPHLPADKPRYLMGVGTPDDLLESVSRGIDMFDCVLPTRAGRHGTAYTRHGRLNLKNARHADDPEPIDAESKFAPASTYSKAYLHHLVRSNEILGMMLLTADQPVLLPGPHGRAAQGHRRGRPSPISSPRRRTAGRAASATAATSTRTSRRRIWTSIAVLPWWERPSRRSRPGEGRSRRVRARQRCHTPPGRRFAATRPPPSRGRGYGSARTWRMGRPGAIISAAATMPCASMPWWR